ncbi:MAG: N-acetylmuramoyl-L-alanine amidase [Akkermansiaceae bacterium]|nr:N-acetylmuramoyl-L-alanine amidase [Akkermansiaceae bacterium]MCP5545380.1 N-acetylmuramoyl-L-alanine amidase [Akkermansiaceae bacterium]
MKRRNPYPILLVLALLAACWWVYRREKPQPPAPPAAVGETVAPPPALSVLGEAPDWSKLEIYQETIGPGEFERLLDTVFSSAGGWRPWVEIGETEARIRTGRAEDDEWFHLRFATTDATAPRTWRSASELGPAPPGRPMEGMKVAIDPGHIGGRWAKMEERWFVHDGGTPVREGDMTLAVAKLLKPKLEALGAEVSLVRDKTEPITELRPDSLMDVAGSPDTAATGDPRKLAERLFYRTAEIRARAKRVNEQLQPDLVLCLHFNADPWGDPNKPTLVDRHHLHLLLNGSYTPEEVALTDQRFAMLEKLLSRTHAEEAAVGATVAEVFAQASGLPPFLYPSGAPNALMVAGNPYLWARNLLANRLYEAPVIFMEPYVMNSKPDHARIQAGDYAGLREIDGKLVPSIFREYADALADGLATHYRRARGAGG